MMSFRPVTWNAQEIHSALQNSVIRKKEKNDRASEDWGSIGSFESGWLRFKLPRCDLPWSVAQSGESLAPEIIENVGARFAAGVVLAFSFSSYLKWPAVGWPHWRSDYVTEGDWSLGDDICIMQKFIFIWLGRKILYFSIIRINESVRIPSTM